MDTRVLLANTNKRYEAIFNGLGILNNQITQQGNNTIESLEVFYSKLVEIDNKLDAIMAHLGIELPPAPVEPGTTDPVEAERAANGIAA